MPYLVITAAIISATAAASAAVVAVPNAALAVAARV